jgi:hypothetical protein
MGSSAGMICSNCRHHFVVAEGGGFAFHLLHCDRCGRTKSIGFDELGDLHSAYLKGLPGPYSIISRQHDLQVKAEYPGPALSEPEYHAAIERSLKRHRCGGRFRFDAPPRCPKCRSTELEPDPDGPMILHD